MTTKKMYEKPSMKVVPLRRKPQLLVGSYTTSGNVNATMSGTFDEETLDE